MKLKILLNSLIGLFLIGLILNSCQKEENEISNNFPTTLEQIKESDRNTKLIVEEGGIIIEDAISNANNLNDLIDPSLIAEQIEGIKGVDSAEPTPAGTGIVVKQQDGTYTNLLIITQDDERLFIENSTKSANIYKSVLSVNEDIIIPNGDGRALILAPFQKEFNKDYNQIEQLLKTAGYQVERYDNENASLDRFYGDFLNQFDVIFIDTHGLAMNKTVQGKLTTTLTTGEEWDSDKMWSLPQEQRITLAKSTHNKKTYYFAITTQWLNVTTTNNFPNSWFFAGACESAKTDEGPSSLSECLLNLGVIGYNGYNEVIINKLSEEIEKIMVGKFTSGLNFTDASEEVLNNWGLKAKAWGLRLGGKFINEDPDKIRVDLFDYIKQKSDQFYLIDPDSDSGQVLYSEDFSTDPNYTSLSPTKAYWDETDGNYYVKTFDDLKDKYWAYSPKFETADSKKNIVINLDMLCENADWGTYPGTHFYNSEPTDISNESRTLSVRFVWADSSYKKLSIGSKSGDKTASYISANSFENNKWYTVKINYYASNNKADIVVTDKDSGSIFYQETNVDFFLSDFSYLGIGYYNTPNYGDSWSPIRIDNIGIKHVW